MRIDYLGFAVDVENGAVSVRQDGFSGFRVEADGCGSARSRVESEYGFEGVFVEDLTDIQPVLFHSAKLRFEHCNGSFTLPEEVNLHVLYLV